MAIAEEQGLDAVLLFPTLGCGVEQALRDDIGTMASLSAFNRWLEELSGFDEHGVRRIMRDNCLELLGSGA